MSTLKELLNDVPVEWKTLGELASLITTGRLNANAMEENGAYPFFTCNEKPYKINSFAFDLEAILISGNGSQVGHLNYYKGKFNAYQRTYVVGEFTETVYIMYVFHYLNFMLKGYIELNSRKGSVPYITMPMLQNLLVPIPYPNDPQKSLKVQQEIVRVLDVLSEQNKALTSALANEIDNRKKQYAYYREELFRFEGKEAEWKTLGEVFEFKNGINKGKEFFGKGDKIINYTDVFRNSKIFEENLLGKVEITESDIQRFNCRRGDVFFTRTSETKDEIGYASVLLSDIDICVFSGFLIRARPLTNLLFPEYCSYCFSTDLIRKKIISSSNMTTRVTTTGSILSKIEIPVPPIQDQERIVCLLDQYDEATKNIVAQLEKEIELRNKQYKYYRNLLLTFPKDN